MTLFDEEMDEHLVGELEELCVPVGNVREQVQWSAEVRWAEETALRFTVVGEAKTAGSKRAFVNPKTGRAIITEDARTGRSAKTWRQEVAATALTARQLAPWGDELLLGPCVVEFTFRRPRPKGHYGSGRNAGVVRSSAPPAPATRPDVLKLARAVEDALTGILWKDDAQIVDERLRKVWGEPERCEIVVRAL